ncbi:UDP-glucose 4-epimerase GalE [Lichenicoccus roseus]|uniref:UDP-glucose 4-epimerase n=1 Tax=Lichenicoccus roseus TaxID=2683649 RepID=A0A5R9JBW2_9PROT|nr:UDP-glucose 4-epimerase GalE [Lichenicoccus roseus]TLU74243.1 UDP-glucose 4-epimerase GalE [Lichenicoccus roseus]
MADGKRYLVTGGAGYVGSHAVLALADRGDRVTVLDDLSLGHAAAIPSGVELIRGTLADTGLIERVLSEGSWEGVLHFASLSLVGDSMLRPMHYFMENSSLGFRLIDACIRHGVRRFVLSSTAALFGRPGQQVITEDAPVEPGSPYGESKAMLERALAWADRVHGLRSACLRYFNAAGADPQGRAGEDHTPETHLIPLVIDAALGRRAGLSINGDDYDTPDGTCIRDYVHVSDLATAHLRALEQLGDRSVTYNLGSGHGHSVLEVIRSVERVSGRQVPYSIGPRRAGDPPKLVALSERLRRETGWEPRFERLDDIVATAFAWREAHPDGYGDR